MWACALALSSQAVLAQTGCATDPDRLPQLQRQFYDNLSQSEQEALLNTKRKNRETYLKGTSLWPQWEALTSDQKTRVNNREVKAGDPEFAAHMAWGPPADVKEVQKGERAVKFETYIQCTSGPRSGAWVRQNIDCDGTSSEVQLAIEAGLVTEVKYLN